MVEAEVAADSVEEEAVGAVGVANIQVMERDPARDCLVGTNHQKADHLKVLHESIGKKQSHLGRVLSSATRLGNWDTGII